MLGHDSISFFEATDGMAVCIGRDARLEREANIFAAELLMPKIISMRETHKYTLQDLARRYQVSVQAIEIRLEELSLATEQCDIAIC